MQVWLLSRSVVDASVDDELGLDRAQEAVAALPTLVIDCVEAAELTVGCAGEQPSERTTSMSFRLAAYAVCIEDGRVLLARYVSPAGDTNWTLPGGQVEHAEDPFDTVVREVAEETGCAAVVERLLGVDSRVIPAAEARSGIEHHNVGVFYRVRITGGVLRPEPNGATAESAWTPIPDVAGLCRSSLVDVGLALARALPATGHVPPVAVGGLIRH